MRSPCWGHDFDYVTNILYDQYGQRTRIDYGNGTFTEYNYDPARRWLDMIKTENKWGQTYQNISYSFDAVGNVLGYENDCLDNASGNYKTKQTYSYDNLYQLIKVNGETTYNPYRSSMPEFKSDYSQVFTFDPDGLGNMTSKVSTEAVSPQKSIGDNLNYNFNYVYNENYAHRLVRAGDRYYKYDANGNIVCEQDGSFESNGDDVSYHKITKETENVYSTDYGWGLFSEENGSGGGVKGSRYCRTYAWNEKNQLISSVDSNYNTAYVYGQDEQRSNKYTANSETLYFNKMWTLHTDSGNNIYGGQTAKNIYLGETRIVTKLNSGTNPTYQEEYYKQYYYHSDHLGSASLISDYKGDEYQRIEYTPYGETWVEKTNNTGLEWLPYKFTAKEIDKETGLYYYGARYLDPKYSRWISTDPALGDYISKTSKGEGGIYNPVNLSFYHYAGNNPVKYVDPDGNYLKVSGGFSYRRQIAKELRKLSPKAWINPFTGTVHNNNPFMKINGHEKGNQLINELIEDNNTVTVNSTPMTNNATTKPLSDDAFRSDSEGSDSDIQFNPNIDVSLSENHNGRVTNVKAKPSIVLGHELIHALHNAKGKNKRMQRITEYTDNLGNTIVYRPGKSTSVEELNTTGVNGFFTSDDITENTLRGEQNLDERVRY